MSIRETIARWISPELARKAERYFYLRSRVDEAYWWLAAYRDAAEVAQWLREKDDDHWRGIDQPATGELPSQIGNLRDIITRRVEAQWEENRKARDIDYQLGIGADPDMLEHVAFMIDCMPGCDNGYSEFDTNAFVCGKIEKGECGFVMAEDLRALATAFRNRDEIAPKKPSYHDVYVTTPKIRRTAICNLPFRVRLTCSRIVGWSLVALGEGGLPEEELGHEFSTKTPLRIDVACHLICDYPEDYKP